MGSTLAYSLIYTTFSFDFQALRNVHDIQFGRHIRDRGATFARSERRPMKAIAIENRVKIEYRDSYVLTQKSLKNWAKDSNLSIQKLDVDDDFYLKIRTPYSKLDQHTILYGCFDVATMIAGLKSYRSKYKSVENIPLTQTGAVRRDCIENISLKNPEWARRCCEITKNYTFDFFLKLVSLFQGGWTHANASKTNKLLKNLRCFDFASSYPGVMVSRKMPVGEFYEVDPSQFDEVSQSDINNGPIRWFAEIKFKDVQSKIQNTYWSSSKILFDNLVNAVTDNGRIYSADEMTVALTDLDYDTFTKAYFYGDIEVLSLYVAEADYLPKEMIEVILKYYGYKTSLKGVDGSESLYKESKSWINSIFGCAVTKIVTDEIEYYANLGWHKTKCDEPLFIETINAIKPEQTFLTYAIGIWITSWARHNLWDFIVKFDKRIAYCDTDSIKGEFTDDDLVFIEEYNKHIEDLENDVAKTIGIDPALYAPKTSKGKTKRIGIMEREEDVEEFITKGAKRYCDSVDGKIECTIAGLPKKAGPAKLKTVSDFLSNNLEWNTSESMKQTVYYNDNQPTVSWTDDDGITWIESNKYGACILPTTFNLSMTDNYIKFVALCQGDLHPDEVFNDISLTMFTRTYQT